MSSGRWQKPKHYPSFPVIHLHAEETIKINDAATDQFGTLFD
jgi:hypothetical protein